MTTRLRGRVVLPDQVLEDGAVTIEGTRIVAVGPGEDVGGGGARRVPLIVPGFVDLHCHGGGGDTVAEGTADAVRRVARHHLVRGTTTMVASLVSAPPGAIHDTIATIAQIVVTGDTTVVGSHLEGPFLGSGHCGAHDPAQLLQPSAELVESWLRAGQGTVRMVTLAPELTGAPEVAEQLAGAGVLIALGHSDADAACFGAALAARRTPLVTHLFNGMAPMHHRDPGPVAASLTALARGQAYVELIADGVHVADEIVELVFAIDRAGRVVLVSDAMGAAGMTDGDYQLGRQELRVEDGIARTVLAPHALAGSTVHLADVVRHAVVSIGLDPVAAVNAASGTPATLLGLADRGRIAPGLRADLLVLDDGWAVTDAMTGGEWVR